MRLGHVTEQASERELVCVGRLLLITEKDHAMPQQRSAQLGELRYPDVATDANTPDDGPDHAADLGDSDVLEMVVRSNARRVVQYLSHAASPSPDYRSY